MAEKSLVEELVTDFDAALDDLRRALADGDDTATRRSLRCSLACLYELREYREGSGSDADAYHLRANLDRDGETTEAIIWVRGKMTHQLTHQMAPEQQVLYPSPKLYTSNDLFPGSNLGWRKASDIAHQPEPTGESDRAKAERRRRRSYETWVAGMAVVPSLELARSFLMRDPGPSSSR